MHCQHVQKWMCQEAVNEQTHQSHHHHIPSCYCNCRRKEETLYWLVHARRIRGCHFMEKGRSTRTPIAAASRPTLTGPFYLILPMESKDNNSLGRHDRVTNQTKIAHSVKLFEFATLLAWSARIQHGTTITIFSHDNLSIFNTYLPTESTPAK
jgi:hypothetical protein